MGAVDGGPFYASCSDARLGWMLNFLTKGLPTLERASTGTMIILFIRIQ